MGFMKKGIWRREELKGRGGSHLHLFLLVFLWVHFCRGLQGCCLILESDQMISNWKEKNNSITEQGARMDCRGTKKSLCGDLQ